MNDFPALLRCIGMNMYVFPFDSQLYTLNVESGGFGGVFLDKIHSIKYQLLRTEAEALYSAGRVDQVCP